MRSRSLVLAAAAIILTATSDALPDPPALGAWICSAMISASPIARFGSFE